MKKQKGDYEMIKSALLCFALAQAACFVLATTTDEENKPFYVYSDRGASTNHFIPSGWMGDYGDLKLDDQNTESPQSDSTSRSLSMDSCHSKR
jgi:hypothetical protein